MSKQPLDPGWYPIDYATNRIKEYMNEKGIVPDNDINVDSYLEDLLYSYIFNENDEMKEWKSEWEEESLVDAAVIEHFTLDQDGSDLLLANWFDVDYSH